jgi:RecB family exonuclease/Fe-S cluster biosynthesis and repair protein YggX
MRSFHFSAADVLWECPGILDFDSPKNIFRERNNADRGDRFHAFCEFFLTYLTTYSSYKEVLHESEVNGKNWTFKDEEEQNEFIKWGELVWNRIKFDWDDNEGEKELRLEAKLEYHINKDWKASGRADAILICPDKIYIYDFKTGYVEVSATDNGQLKITAEVLKTLGFNPGFGFEGVIIQPSLGITDPAPIFVHGEEYWDKLKEVLSKREKPLKVGKACTYCDKADVCPEFDKYLKMFSNPIYLDQKINRPERWSEILELAKPIRKALENIEATALAAAKAGVEIPGWKLEGRNGKRIWNHSMHAASLASWLSLKKTDVIEEKLVSPAEIEKKIKTEKQKEKFSMVVSQPLYFAFKKDKGEEVFRKFSGKPVKEKKSKPAYETALELSRDLGKSGKSLGKKESKKVIKKTAGKTAKRSKKK